MNILPYLLGSEPWLEYAVSFALLAENRQCLEPLKQRVLQDDKIKAYLTDIRNFHSAVVSTHKNPGLSVHKLLFLLDIGLQTDVPEIAAAIGYIMSHKDVNGVYQSHINVPKHFGGTGQDSFGWCLCDAPLLLTALLRAGIPYDNRIRPGVAHLGSLYRSGAFPCVVSPELGRFRGPGRKEDCCPYATLIMLRLFAHIPEYADSEMAKRCADTLLSLWENSRNAHPYMFYMGTDFRKLKAPLVWYDVVSVADVLILFRFAREDSRFAGMLSVIESKQDNEGLYTPESVYLKCSAWDFGQKKTPSPYLTHCCERILKRMNER
jgi:hypothetical protein